MKILQSCSYSPSRSNTKLMAINWQTPQMGQSPIGHTALQMKISTDTQMWQGIHWHTWSGRMDHFCWNASVFAILQGVLQIRSLKHVCLIVGKTTSFSNCITANHFINICRQQQERSDCVCRYEGSWVTWQNGLSLLSDNYSPALHWNLSRGTLKVSCLSPIWSYSSQM